MNFVFSQKTWPSAKGFNLEKMHQKGGLTLMAALFVLLFSIIGLSMIHMAQIHLKLGSIKKNAQLLEFAAENGIKKGFKGFLDRVSQMQSPLILSSSEATELKQDAYSQGQKIIERLLGSPSLLSGSESQATMRWGWTTDFILEKFDENENYIWTNFRTLFHSQGRLLSFSTSKESQLEASLQLYLGNIPLPNIPMLIEKELKKEEKDRFLEFHNIKIPTSSLPHMPQSIFFTEENLIPEDASSQINKALRIELEKAENLSSPLLRAALGLEISDEPVPDGVYLVKDDVSLGGLFVQGDIEEMILAIKDDSQVISIKKEEGKWLCQYNPTLHETIFRTPENEAVLSQIPVGIIIVNGQILSLGGGTIDSSGEPVIVHNQELPCVHRGIRITIVCSKGINLTSHLIQEGVKWQEGLPKIKDLSSQLILFSTGQDFIENIPCGGHISIDENAPQNIKIHASLTAGGEGLKICGENKDVHVLGSLHVKDYSSQNNSLTFYYDNIDRDEPYKTPDAPLSEKPILFISDFKISQWIDFEL